MMMSSVGSRAKKHIDDTTARAEVADAGFWPNKFREAKYQKDNVLTFVPVRRLQGRWSSWILNFHLSTVGTTYLIFVEY